MKVSWIGWAALAISALLMGLTHKFSAIESEGPKRLARATTSPGRPASSEWLLQRSATGRNMRYTAKDAGGQMTWDLFAISVKYDKELKRVEGTDVRCVLLGENQAPLAVLVSRGAILNTETMDVAFAGEVRARSKRGEIITVPQLWYSSSKKRFFGRGGVRITRGDTVLTGDTMVGVPSLDEVTLSGHVRVAGGAKALQEAFAVKPQATSAPGRVHGRLATQHPPTP